MAIQVRCCCGQVFRFKDNAAGKKTQCKGCGAVVEIPAQGDSSPERMDGDFSGLLSEALEMAKESAEVFPEIEQMHLARGGDISRSPAPCPHCGRPVPRSAATCKSCKTSLRLGHCACCGIKIDVRERGSGSTKRKCKCDAFPVVWGEGTHGAICTNCGRAWQESPGRVLKRAAGSERNPALTCPWCALDKIIDKDDNSNRLDQPFGGAAAFASRTARPKRRTDEDRLLKIERLIENIQTSLKEASQDARQQKVAGMFSSTLSAVFWSAILGPFGVGMAALSHQKQNEEIEKETGVNKLQTRVSALTLLHKRFCFVSGLEPLTSQSWLEKLKGGFSLLLCVVVSGISDAGVMFV